MKTFTPRFAATLSVFVAFSVPATESLARVGETRDVVERRIVQPNLGKIFFRPREKDPNSREAREAERERQREEREQPFNDVRVFFPTDTQEVIYWKSALANRLSNENGWKVHVFYMGGRSSMEAYRRVGESLNEFEVRALLAANRGASVWKKISGEGGGTNGIAYDYELEDGSLRAKQQGNWLMFYSTRLNSYVIEQQKIAKELRDRELELLKQEQQGKAPESVMGF